MICSRCHCEKPIEAFAVGQTWCRECYREYRRRPEVRERQRIQCRARYRLNPQRYYEYARRWALNHRTEYNAEHTLGYAIKTGKIVSQPCEVCGDPHADAHHDDYSKPYEVRWLCRRHHREAHAGVRQLEEARR